MLKRILDVGTNVARRIVPRSVVRGARGVVSKSHFVEDYENLVARLVKRYPLDEAMERAVGGGYEHHGRMQAGLLRRVGLVDGMRLVDLGCGSGRLANQLHKTMKISYTGIDIIPTLLDYARGKAPSYKFILHRDLSIPQPDASADMVSAFSVFTHLQHAEIYIYLAECKRILEPGGTMVFSFHEFADPTAWQVFDLAVKATRERAGDHLDMFVERAAITVWAQRLGMDLVEFVDSTVPIVDGHPLGQSAAVLRKPKA